MRQNHEDDANRLEVGNGLLLRPQREPAVERVFVYPELLPASTPPSTLRALADAALGRPLAANEICAFVNGTGARANLIQGEPHDPRDITQVIFAPRDEQNRHRGTFTIATAVDIVRRYVTTPESQPVVEVLRSAGREGPRGGNA